MQGYAYTIFAGDQVEKFDLEVIGIMPALDRDEAHGSGHFRFGHAHDGLRCLRN